MTNLNAGLLGPAIRWSWAGLTVGVVGWITLLAWSVGDEMLMSNEFHRLSTTTLAILILGSLMVQLTARLIRGQRKLAILLDQPAILDPDVIDIGRRLTSRLRDES